MRSLINKKSPTMKGILIAIGGGVISGLTFNQPLISSVVTLLTIELGRYIFENLREYFIGAIMSEELKEWIAMFAIFLIIISIVNVIFNFTNYRKRIKNGELKKDFPSWDKRKIIRWNVIWNLSLWGNIIIYLIISLSLRNQWSIGAGLFISLIYIFCVEVILYPIVKRYIKQKNKS